MPTFNLKIRRVKSYNMQKAKFGYTTRAIINGMETFDSVAEEAARNTTLNKYELQAALGIAAEQFARALKNGFAIDLGPIGKIYPNVISKWTEKPEEQRKADLKPSVRYDMSAEIREAVAGCKLSWDNLKDEEMVEEEVVEEEVTGGEPPINPTEYTLTYIHNGQPYSTQQLEAGATITPPAAPTGYHWVNVPATMPAEDLTIQSAEDEQAPPSLE